MKYRFDHRFIFRATKLRRFAVNDRGNVAIITSLTMLAFSGLVGMGIDYTMAGRREAQFNAIADAAALSTTTPTSLGLTAAQAQANAVQLFNAQAALVGGVTFTPLINANCGSPSQVCVTDTTAANGAVTRNTTVAYTATSTNAFGTLLKMASMPLGGTSKVSSSTAPNIDFYILLDTSPSMGIPSSQAGIDTMVQNTSQQGGCAFACHETNPTAGEVKGNPKGTGAYANGIDNYMLARNLGLTLRIDLVQQATANLYSTAKQTGAQNKAKYRVATYTFDASFQTITNLTSDLTSAQNDTSKINMLQVYNENNLTSSNANSDEDSQFDDAMSNAGYIPAPGKGTNASGDTPQEILFIVTDGVIDQAYNNQGPTDMSSNGRNITYVGYQVDYCTPLKKRGVRVAVLYTPYLPLPTNSFYNQYVDPFQPKVPTALQACASPGLFFQVNTGGDINSAMQALFAKAISSAHLTQ